MIVDDIVYRRFGMILNIAKHEAIGGIQNGVYYFNLPNYPYMSIAELKIVLAFILYEKSYNRQTEIKCML